MMLRKNMKKEIVGTGIFLLVVGCATLIFSLVVVPFATAEPVVLPQSSYLITGSFTVPPRYTSHNETLSNGDKLHILVEVTSGGNSGIDFYVMDEPNYGKWKAGESASPQISRTNMTTVEEEWVVPHDGTWYFVYDNTFGSASEDVTTIVTKHWTETAYREVTEYRPLIPSEFSFVGGIVLLGGVAALVSGKIVKEAPVASSRNNISIAPSFLTWLSIEPFLSEQKYL